ncbi:hypothetical protein EBL89_02980 [Cereibacter sphaeroides]|nr:hypothetical protein EBL89_02980 [Cereibacter sphaeroides]AZB58593.1 hypothetical protein EBL88_03010 [Cereibacter sphaeroides]
MQLRACEGGESAEGKGGCRRCCGEACRAGRGEGTESDDGRLRAGRRAGPQGRAAVPPFIVARSHSRRGARGSPPPPRRRAARGGVRVSQTLQAITL